MWQISARDERNIANIREIVCEELNLSNSSRSQELGLSKTWWRLIFGKSFDYIHTRIQSNCSLQRCVLINWCLEKIGNHFSDFYKTIFNDECQMKQNYRNWSGDKPDEKMPLYPEKPIGPYFVQQNSSNHRLIDWK